MLTGIRVKNFKRFDEIELELGNTVVFIGPNNSGKTTALQALALWDVGLKRWHEKRSGSTAEKRSGVAVNRRDLIALPVPTAKYLWRDLHLREGYRGDDGKNRTRNIRIEVEVEGVTGGKAWRCGLEFDYANEESIYCRPLQDEAGERMDIPDEALAVEIAYLPPMSGLAANETRLDPGAVNVRLGEGRTAEVLRNLCYQLYEHPEEEPWRDLQGKIRDLFGIELEPPRYIPERGEITMTYRDRGDLQLDLSSAGRGLQQTLLLLAHLKLNPQAVILVDEPDAHLEILRQRQIYQMLSETADRSGSQVILASHAEVILNEAADRDLLIAFVGKPHRIDDRGFQAAKALKEIGFEHYYQATQTGWVLYLEGSTDLAILRAFAEVLDHDAREALERPFVHYVGRHDSEARSHFFGLREAKRDLVGFALYDRLDKNLDDNPYLRQHQWTRREIENYLCREDVLLRWTRAAAREQLGDLFATQWENDMRASILHITEALRTLDKVPSPWSPDTKVSDDFLTPLFKDFFRRLGLPNLMQKTDYHQLARFVEPDEMNEEVVRVLDRIVETAGRARPEA